MSRKFSTILISCITYTIVTSASALSPVYVSPTYTNTTSGNHTFGIDAFTKIQDGISAVDQGGIVYVAQGTYNENIVITKSLSLIGEEQKKILGASKNAPHINGGTSTNLAVITIIGDSKVIIVTVHNFNITHANNGINVLQNALATIEHNTVSNYYKNGITFGPVRFPGYGGVRGIISNNIVTGSGPTNTAAQNGIQVSEGNTASITNNHVSNHFYTIPNSWWGVGILTNQSDGISIYNNTLVDNQTGINIKEGSNNLVSTNIITGTATTEAGILLSESETLSHPVQNNIITNNTITGGKKSILAHNNISNNIFTSNTFNTKYITMGVDKSSHQSFSEAQNNQGMVLGVTAFTFLQNLQEGDSGNDVVELQKILITDGLLDGQATGYFGLQTKNALMNWQSKNNISMTGYFGNISRAYFNSKK